MGIPFSKREISSPAAETLTRTGIRRATFLVLTLLAGLSPGLLAARVPLPTAVAAQLPSGYTVLAAKSMSAGRPVRSFMIVALGRKDEAAKRSENAPARPLLLFERQLDKFLLVGRNDHVLLKADEGGQCDPFLDGDATIAVEGPYFTVQNGVACGEHWTDFITFRFDGRNGAFVFDNERRESWSLNPSQKPDAEALVPDGKPTVIREQRGHLTTFNMWRPTN